LVEKALKKKKADAGFIKKGRVAALKTPKRKTGKIAHRRNHEKKKKCLDIFRGVASLSSGGLGKEEGGGLREGRAWETQ